MKRMGKLGGETASTPSGSREGTWWVPHPHLLDLAKKMVSINLDIPGTIAPSLKCQLATAIADNLYQVLSL